jgi:acetyl-CoA C-acetyltransferase
MERKMKVGIVAAAQNHYGEHFNWRPHELTYLVVETVLNKVGLPFRDGYDDIVTCSADHWDGKTLSDIEHGEMAGAHLGPGEAKTTLDGANAVLLGCIKILSGHSDVVLVTAACKEKQVMDPSVIENFGFDVHYQQILGLDFTQAAALQANSYAYKYNLEREDFAEVAVKERGYAKDNPYVFNGGDITIDDVLGSEILSYPITSMERRPFCDGACALILAKEERARELTDKPVWITGVGSCYDFHNLGDRDLANPTALFCAARDAYRMAGINDPSKEIDIFEISEHYSYQLLLWMEGLGLCGSGEGAQLFKSGECGRRGKMPVNPSGGLLGGVPRYVAGANRVIESFYQLRGDAGERAVNKEPRVGLAHGSYGPAGQHHCVILMERGF